MTRDRSEGRGIRPGLRASERGSVTVETAGALMALTIFFCMLVSGLSAFGAQLALTALARDAARSAALQSDQAGAEQAVRRVLRNASGVRFAVHTDGAFVDVRLVRDFHILRVPGALTLASRASALEESPW